MDQPIRVLHVVGNMSYGGLETLIMNLYRKVDRNIVQFDFLAYTEHKGLYDDEIADMGGKVYHLSFRDDKNYLKYKKDLKQLFESHPEYKIVHGHLAAMGSIYFNAAREAGIPCRISHSHIASFSKTLSGFAKYLMQRKFGKYATERFACSKAAGNYMYGKEKYTVINNGIDCHKFAFDTKERIRLRSHMILKDKLVFIHVGRFFDQKNHTFLLDVFAEIRKKRNDSVLLLVGVGPLLDQIRAKAKSLGIESYVQFLGERTDVPSLLSASDVFLFPSLYEGLPLTVVEAQASGLPILCSDQVTDEVVMTKECYRLPLELGAEKWGEKALEILEDQIDREKRFDLIIANGYDSSTVAKSLQNFYVKKHSEQYTAKDKYHERQFLL